MHVDMSLYFGPVLVTSLGLLCTLNPWGLGDVAFKHLNRYPRTGWSAESARRQAYVLGRTSLLIGLGALIWVLLLDFDAPYGAKAAFLAVAVPPAVALVGWTIVDTARRADEVRRG